ncbi:hypothetical protein [Streptomyces glaucus]|uniref:Integral membrane protein n=1 Tax=Streptomyces glaucus TaxID=284029 RepID=A0ABN3J4A3_9ACTN
MVILAPAAESADDIWAAVQAVAAVIAIPVAIGLGLLAYRAVWPRRKLRWSARVRPLVSHDAAHTNRLAVVFQGVQLVKPHIVEVELSNVGNKDLEPAHFNGTPVDIRSSVPIVELLQHGSSPGVQRVLRPTVTGRTVSLDTRTPLHSGQTLTYVMLVDGADPGIELLASVSNTRIERAPASGPVTPRAAFVKPALVLLVATLLVMAASGVLALSRLRGR